MHHPMHMQEYTLLFVQSTFSKFVSEGGGRVNKLSVYLKYYCLRERGGCVCYPCLFCHTIYPDVVLPGFPVHFLFRRTYYQSLSKISRLANCTQPNPSYKEEKHYRRL